MINVDAAGDFSSRMLSSSSAKESEGLLIFMFCGMALGALVTHILSRVKINLSYTVVVFLLGGFASLIIDTDINFGELENSIRSWKKIDPELLLYLFLPALLFGEAMNLKWHHVKGVFPQALLMAGPGVLLGAYSYALFVYFCMPFGWSWYLCMIIGSILSATDPVAVVALLKDAGASPQLTIMIIGESLMNDGTAMVLFTLYYDMMKGDELSPGEIILFFLEEVLCAPLLGITFGLVALYWFSKAKSPIKSVDVIIQIVITVCCAYLSYYTAQALCEISGVLACCAAGIMFAWLSPPLILEHETMHNVWGFVEWVANTLVFLLAGLIIGGSSTESHISKIDFLYTFVMYVALMLVRAGCMAVMFPAVSRIGLKCTPADAKFMVWGGLRGALAVALSLVIYGEREELGVSEKDADKLLFYVGGIAACTLVINATTANFVLKYLGLSEEDDSPHALSLMANIRKRLHESVVAEMEHIETNKYSSRSSSVERSQMLQYNTLISTHADNDSASNKMIREKLSALAAASEEEDAAMEGGGEIACNPEMLAYYRSLFLESVRLQYWQYVEKEKLPRGYAVTQSLLYSIDIALSKVKEEGCADWSYFQSEMETLDQFTNSALWNLMGCFALNTLHNKQKVLALLFKVTGLTSFIDAHEAAQSKWLGLMESLTGESWDGSTMHMLLEQKKVLQESTESVTKAREMLESFDSDDVTSIVAQQGSRMLLAHQIHKVKELLEEGVLDAKNAERLLAVIDHDRLRLKKDKYLNLLRGGESSSSSKNPIMSTGGVHDAEECSGCELKPANVKGQ